MHGLSIKRKDVVERIRRIASVQGLSLTDAVDDAVKAKEAVLGLVPDAQAGKDAEIEAFLARMRARRPPGPLMTDKELDAVIYDENGFPR